MHLEHHDVTYVAVSRAPLPEIEAFKKRMGWRFKWVSSYGSDFNYDFHVSFRADEIEQGKVYYNYEMRQVGIDELSGRSVFYRTRTATYLFLLCPRRRSDARHLQHPRSDAQRPQ